MITLLSPSKSFTDKPIQSSVPATKPDFPQQAQELVDKLNSLSPQKFQKTLGVSDKLTELNKARFQNWEKDKDSPLARQVGWSYIGETYFGFDTTTLSAEQITYANKNVRIISGLYGLLRITDAVPPYRLEMGTRLSGKWGKSLYDYWGSTLAEHLIADGAKTILACASEEYLKAIRPHLPENIRLIVPQFLTSAKDGHKKKMVFVKWSRGLLARYVVDHKIEDPDHLKEFDSEGYEYSSSLSTEDEPVFIAQEGLTLKGRYKKS